LAFQVCIEKYNARYTYPAGSVENGDAETWHKTTIPQRSSDFHKFLLGGAHTNPVPCLIFLPKFHFNAWQTLSEGFGLLFWLG